MARTFAALLSPRIAGRFSADPSTTFAEYVSSQAIAGDPAESPLHAKTILQFIDALQPAATLRTRSRTISSSGPASRRRGHARNSLECLLSSQTNDVHVAADVQ
eukprot:6913944-Pyramimonas_sp.AAC.2